MSLSEMDVKSMYGCQCMSVEGRGGGGTKKIINIIHYWIFTFLHRYLGHRLKVNVYFVV